MKSCSSLPARVLLPALRVVVMAVLCAVPADALHAASGIDGITTSTSALGSSVDYVAARAPDGPPSVGDTNTMNFASGGSVVTTILDDITVGATTLKNLTTSDSTFFRRNAVTLPAEPDRQLIWYDASRVIVTPTDYTFNILGGRAFSMSDALTGTAVSWGTDNVFDNDQSNKNNIERIDFVYDGGIQPQNASQLAVGFSVLERGGNDTFKIAAITGIDGSGNPTSYGALTLSSAEWGAGLLATDTVIVRGPNSSPYEYEPSGFVEGQSIAGVFFSLSDLGVNVLDTFYGYSLFGADTTGADGDLLDWNNATYFPTDTTSVNGGLDLISGGILWNPDGLDTTGLLVPEPGSALLVLVSFLAALGRRRARGTVPLQKPV